VNRRPGYRCRHGHTSAHPADAEGPRWVYWSQARLVDEILAAGGGELAGCADAGQVAALLRARDVLIVCGPDTVTLEYHAADHADAEGYAVDEVLGNGQLILPLPTGPTRKRNGYGERIPRPRPGNRNPLRDHPERE
jgi:hypothetical protein